MGLILPSEIVMWFLSRAYGFLLGYPVSQHTYEDYRNSQMEGKAIKWFCILCRNLFRNCLNKSVLLRNNTSWRHRQYCTLYRCNGCHVSLFTTQIVMPFRWFASVSITWQLVTFYNTWYSPWLVISCSFWYFHFDTR